MAKARNWEALSSNTRKRYERAGISRTDYMSGMSLKTARGHATTPEHPNRKIQPGQEQYFLNKIVNDAFADYFKFSGPMDLDDLPDGINYPTIEQLEYALTLTDMEVWQLAHEPDWNFLFYHGSK